jgi:hypothetical protein
MTCTNHCCGFIALTGMIGIGALTVSHGLGSCQYDPIIQPEEVLFQEGTGLDTVLRARIFDGPKTVLRYPDLQIDPSDCDWEGVLIEVVPPGAPKVIGDGPPPEEPAQTTGSRATTQRGPTTALRSSSEAEEPLGPQLSASTSKGPQGAARAAEEPVQDEGGTTIVATPEALPGPKVTGEGPAPEEGPEDPSTATTKPGPKTVVRKG